ncbi:MAG: ATP-binding protein [Acidobacteriota bacterium]
MHAHSTFHCTPENVKDVRTWISGTLLTGGVEPDVVNRILLAASEAVTNCIVHGYKPRREGRVDVSIDIGMPSVQLVVRDYGAGLQMDQYDSPDTDLASEGGYGIYLIRSLMDDVRLAPQIDGTELTMTIFRERAQDA